METIDRHVQHAQDSQRVGRLSGGRPITVTAPSRTRNVDLEQWPNEPRSVPPRGADSPTLLHELNGGLNAAEIRRRFCHILPGFLAFLLPLIPHTHPLSIIMLLRMSVLATVLALGVILLFRTIARPGEHHWVLNVISYPATIIMTLLLFPGYPELATVVLVVLAFGDGSATLFGLLKGGQPLPWNAKKTWIGTMAFLFCAAPLAALAYWEESAPHVSVSVAVAVGIITTIVAGVAESIPLRVSDNLRVGVSAMLGVVASHVALVGW